MIFPPAAVLVWAWLILTPTLRIVLRMFAAQQLGPLTRLLIAHLAALAIIVGASAIVFSGQELAGMSLLFAIAQAIAFVVDFMRAGIGRAPER